MVRRERNQPFDPRKDNREAHNRNEALDSDYEDDVGKSQRQIPTLFRMDGNGLIVCERSEFPRFSCLFAPFGSVSGVDSHTIACESTFRCVDSKYRETHHQIDWKRSFVLPP